VEGHTWSKARKICQRSYRDFVAFESDFYWEKFKLNILPNWSNKFNNYWHIGLQIDSLGNWTWVNGWPLTISHWHPGEPYPSASFAAMASYPTDTRGSFKGVTNDTVAGFVCQGIRPK